MACKMHEDSYSMMIARKISDKLEDELKGRELEDYNTLSDMLDIHSIALTGQLAEKNNVKVTKETIKKTCMDLGKTCLELLLKIAKDTGEIK